MSSINSLIIIYLQPPGYLISVVLTNSKINHKDRIRLNHLKNIASKQKQLSYQRIVCFDVEI